MWGASLILLGFVLQHIDNPQLTHIVLLVSILGILMNVKVWVYTHQLAAVKNHKYDRCKVIESQLGLKQHSTLDYASGRQKLFYSAVMILFIVVWVFVAATAICMRAGLLTKRCTGPPCRTTPAVRTTQTDVE